jgi:RND family efflux transporter MFP subunit
VSTDPRNEPTAADAPRPRRVAAVLAVAMAALAAAVVVLGVLPAVRRAQSLAAEAQARASELPRVVFVPAAAAPRVAKVTLPARMDADQETSLLAQVSGYLGSMTVDVGDHVRKGQLLVRIETPVLDRQIEQNASARNVAQAKIDLAQARQDLSRATLARLRSVGDARAVSQQALDEAAANEKTDGASLAAARADLGAVEAEGHRLEAQRSLASIAAPFDGEVTARSYDAGMLVVADRVDESRPIFRVVDRSVIQASIDVPQSLAAGVQDGQDVEFTVRELPGRAFRCTVDRTVPALERASRTRLVQARIPNPDGALLPGMFAQATITIPRPPGIALVPGEAVVIRDGKQVVATIDDQDTLHYAAVELGRDNGTQVEVLSGLAPGARVATNIARQLPEGTKVSPVARPAPPAPAGAPKPVAPAAPK